MSLSKITTYNPTEEIEFNWVIENFKSIGDTVYCPPFLPVPNFGEKWRIMLKYDYTYLDLHLVKEKSCIENCIVTSTFNFKSVDCDATMQIGHPSDSRRCIGNEKSYMLNSRNVSSQYKWLSTVNELEVNVKLTVSGYNVTYSPCPRPAISLDDNCHDLLSDLENLYGDTTTADITFLIEGKKLFAHSTIVGCRSIVFAKMFKQDMLERKNRCVHITDASFQVFDCFLKYLYTAKVKNKCWDTMFNMYSLAEKYVVSALKAICSSWLGMNLKVDTVVKCLALSALHGDMELKQVSMEFIRDHLSDVLKTSDWQLFIVNQTQLASETLSYASAR